MKTASELGKPTYTCLLHQTHTHTQTNFLIHIKGISIFHAIFLTNAVLKYCERVESNLVVDVVTVLENISKR